LVFILDYFIRRISITPEKTVYACKGMISSGTSDVKEKMDAVLGVMTVELLLGTSRLG
jgi:hypothetical protein